MAGYSGNNRSRRDLGSGVGGRTPKTTNLSCLAGLHRLVRLLIAGILLDYGKAGNDGQDTPLESDVHGVKRKHMIGSYVATAMGQGGVSWA